MSRVRSARHGIGTIVIDNGATVVVRFDHGIEECPRTTLDRLRSLEDSLADGEWDAAPEVVTRALAHAIVSVNDAWGVFSRSRIALLPHQLWVCRRVLSRWPARWLVADDVGLGKTIEAGLILWPVLSRGLVRRLLILCPASLVEQWQYRLRTMFDIRVAKYTTEADTARSDFWNAQPLVVASLETMRLDRGDRHERLLESDPWDMLLVDEAHHVNASEEAGPTLAYQLTARLVESRKVQSIVFFTGTPHRGKDFGFLALLRLLRPDIFDPRKPLQGQLKHLREVVIRNNKQNVTDLKGKRLFQPHIVTSETYSYSEQEADFYRMLTEFILTGKTYASSLGAADQRLVMLVLISMQKLASSSVAAIRRALRGRLERLVAEGQQLDGARARAGAESLRADYAASTAFSDEDTTSSLDEQIAAASVRLMKDEVTRLRELLEVAGRVQRETKIERIVSLVDSRFQGRSVLFFTEYKATQSLLMSELTRHFGDTCAFINGDERADEVIDSSGKVRALRQTRDEAATLFNEGRVRFLVSTEAGGEGIDLQEQCHTLVHVDLPWNPMRLHQRVGRLNRYGQKHQVEVLTLRNPDTVESRIWEKLNTKIGNIMLAFGHIMDEPEDLLQLVLGMTSPTIFTELFAEGGDVSPDRLSAWFDQRTAKFGGKDVVATVKEIVGNCQRFDFQSVGKDIPPVDLPDLRPFFEAMLALNRRRARRGTDGTLGFKTPDTWLTETAVRNDYEGLHFERGARGKDALRYTVGIGHKAFDQAILQALGATGTIACVSSSVLPSPLVIARMTDRVTGGTTPVRGIVGGAEWSAETRAWTFLRDWELMRRLNTVVESRSGLRSRFAARERPAEIRRLIDAALELLETRLTALNLGLELPTTAVLAVLWPGSEVPGSGGDSSAAGVPMDDDAAA
jgi:superfamily II DNA or RNA helicase